MDLQCVKENILTAKQSLAYLLGQVTCNMDSRTPQEAKLTHFCETGRRALTDAAFLAANMSWLESLNLINGQNATKAVLVEFPDFTRMQWLTDPNQKQESFASQLEGLLDDIRSLEIPTCDSKESFVTKTERTFSPTTSDCSSIEIIDYSQDNSGTVTPEDSACEELSMFYEIPNCDGILVQPPQWIEPKMEPDTVHLPPNQISKTLDTSFGRVTGIPSSPVRNTVVENVREGMSVIMNSSDGEWLLKRTKSRDEQQQQSLSVFYPPGSANKRTGKNRAVTVGGGPIRCAISTTPSGYSPPKSAAIFKSWAQCDSSAIDSDTSSVRSMSVKRKADPFLFGVTHGKFTEQSRWLAPPLTNNARVGNASNNSCSDKKRWLVDYRCVNPKRSSKRKLGKMCPEKS